MSSWALRRQLLLLVIPVLLFIAGGYFFYTTYIYRAPTCSDGKQNGIETGVDCGGACQLVCSEQSIAPVVVWSKAFQVSGAVYNAAAYIQNPNNSSQSLSAPYEFRLFDAAGTLVASRVGSIDIKPGKTFAVFEAGIQINGSTVKRTEFAFTGPLRWIKGNTVEPVVTITHTPLERASTSPRLSGQMTNPNLSPIGSTELVALILDGRGNVVDASKTVIDPLSPRASAPFTFTWLKPISIGADTCANASRVLVAYDRSADTQNFSKDTTAISVSTRDFILSLASSSPQVGFLSFASSTTVGIPNGFGTPEEIAQMLQPIQTASTSATTTLEKDNNLAGALEQVSRLFAGAVTDSKNKVLVLVTAGNPTLPTDTTVGTNFPAVRAESVAGDLVSKGVTIYTIGLGSSVDRDLLQSIVDSPDRAFSASDLPALRASYRSISNALCQKSPNVVQILSRSL